MSLLTALAAQKTQFDTDAVTLSASDTRLGLEASVAIEAWYAAAVALATEESNAITSYSLGGRSVTRRPSEDMRATVDHLRSRVEALLFGGSFKVADHRSAADGEES